MNASERLERKWERRRRNAMRTKLILVSGMAVAFAAGFAISGTFGDAPSPKEASAAESFPPAMMATAVLRPPVPEALTIEWRAAETAVDDPEAPVKAKESALEPEPEIAPLLASVPLDGKTQAAIYDLCGQDDSLFCAVMAIANRESRFTPNAIGDNGRCYGMMQINYAYHTERIERLGISDLLDPVQSAAVAIDYLKELEQTYGTSTDSHILYLYYNAGPTGAQSYFDRGIYSTAYTWEVMGNREAYLQEIGGCNA